MDDHLKIKEIESDKRVRNKRRNLIIVTSAILAAVGAILVTSITAVVDKKVEKEVSISINEKAKEFNEYRELMLNQVVDFSRLAKEAKNNYSNTIDKAKEEIKKQEELLNDLKKSLESLIAQKENYEQNLLSLTNFPIDEITERVSILTDLTKDEVNLLIWLKRLLNLKALSMLQILKSLILVKGLTR